MSVNHCREVVLYKPTKPKFYYTPSLRRADQYFRGEGYTLLRYALLNHVLARVRTAALYLRPTHYDVCQVCWACEGRGRGVVHDTDGEAIKTPWRQLATIRAKL
ncbi:hypothetical protein C8R46DRAFT_1205597 [Mycena filopes]|nr:hypothetical protein C8R46DRAFT_1205597 [Mycena filopes]